MTYRASLDRDMRRVLAQLELISAIPAAQPSSSAGTEHPGGRKPPGDKGHTYYARWYGEPFHTCEPRCKHPHAESDEGRTLCLQAAIDELDHLRHGQRVDSSSLETAAQQRERMLTETAGWSPEQVETSSWSFTRFQVRRFRIRDGRDAETGALVDDLGAASGDLIARARELAGRGMSRRAIAMVLGKDKKQIDRYLGKAA